VAESEVEELLANPGEDRPGREGFRVAIGHTLSGRLFPPGWDAERVKRVLSQYESQSEDEAVAEDKAAHDDSSGTMMAIPKDLVPKVLRADRQA
jgi:hypothetical protein